MKRTVLSFLLLSLGLLLILATPVSAQKTLKTLTILGAYGNPGDVDPYTEASRDNGQTWGPAYLTGWHPWGFAPGTNSWVNFDPSPFVGLNSVTDYRITFYIPPDFEQPTMNFIVKADNRARLTINGVFISEFDGQNTGAAGDLALAQSLQSGINEITIRLTDWGGWVGLNYRIDLSMYSEFEPSIRPPSISNQAPDISNAAPSLAKLWPPNHKMVNINVLGVTDPNGDPVTITITKITQDEPINGTGDGDAAPDGDGLGTSTAQVRAERAGKQNGRVYEISFTASDGRGGESQGSVTVGVPRDQGRSNAIVDDGQQYNSITGAINFALASSPSRGEEGDVIMEVIPSEYALGNAYPNPFNPSTTISYDLPDLTTVRLSVFDMLGREVAVLVDGEKAAGRHVVRFNAESLTSGTYIYRIHAGSFSQTRKIMLMK